MATTQTKAEKKARPRLDVQQAVSAAFGYFNKLFSAPAVSDVALEEVEISPDEKYWFVTLGFYEPLSKKGYTPLPDFLKVPIRRYKVFKVDAHSGKVLAMKMRVGE